MNLLVVTPQDFKDKDGNPASPEAAARIANERFNKYREIFKEEFEKSIKSRRCEETRTKNIWEKLTKIF